VWAKKHPQRNSFITALSCIFEEFFVAYSSEYLGLNMGVDAHADPFGCVINRYMQAAYAVRAMGLGTLCSLIVSHSQAFSKLAHTLQYYEPDPRIIAAETRVVKLFFAGPAYSIECPALRDLKLLKFSAQAASLLYTSPAAKLRVIHRTRSAFANVLKLSMNERIPLTT
jgi:hypothetical protein